MSYLERIASAAMQAWTCGDVLRAALDEGPSFPFRISLPSPRGRRLLGQFATARAAIDELHAASTGASFDVEYRSVGSRHAGSQRLPSAAIFASPAALAAFIGRADEYTAFAEFALDVARRDPALRAWLLRFPFEALEARSEWPRLSAVLGYFRARPRSGLHLRQLDIRGVDTKFIERNGVILRRLLDAVLPASAVDLEYSGATLSDFERRYGLASDTSPIRMRLLDPSLCPWEGVDDLTLPPAQFARLALPIERVLIVENKLNALTAPALERAIVVVGQGYRVAQIAAVPWLRRSRVLYWGDIDTHGFAILGALRAVQPETRSILMDEHTLLDHRELWSTEATQVAVEPPHLTDAERDVFHALLDHRHGANVRLEQERVGLSYASVALTSALGTD